LPESLLEHIVHIEMTDDDLANWYERLSLPGDAADRIVVHPLLGYAAAFDARAAESRTMWLDRLNGVDVVVIDCVSPFLAALGLDGNREAGAWRVGVDALMAEAGVQPYMVVHHTGHDGERARGDSRILGWPNQIATLVVETVDRAIRAGVGEQYIATRDRSGRLVRQYMAQRPEAKDMAIFAIVKPTEAPAHGAIYRDPNGNVEVAGNEAGGDAVGAVFARLKRDDATALIDVAAGNLDGWVLDVTADPAEIARRSEQARLWTPISKARPTTVA
jgi:hypothetical protein